MALTKTEIVDKVEVVDTGSWSMVQVRTATVIKRDGAQEVSRSYHRHVVSPADDWSDESDKVKAICDAVHTADTKKAYEASQSDPSTP